MRPTSDEMLETFLKLTPFMGKNQLKTCWNICRTEPAELYGTLLATVDRIETMPKTYEQDGQGMAATVFLHYFLGGLDIYITEKDCEPEQLQAFGYTVNGYGEGEWGYVSLEEILACNVELDLYWDLAPLSEVLATKQAHMRRI